MSQTPTPAGNRWTLVPQSMEHHGSAGGHDEDKIGVEATSVRAGHEPDRFYVRQVVAIPLLIVISVAITYGIVTALFGYFDPGRGDPTGANPQAVAEQSKDYNERVARISTQDPNAEIRQPRLESMKTVQKEGDEPIYYRSMKAADKGNSPEVRPEDLRPENFIDWNTGKKPLAEFDWVSKEKGVARIPVSEAIRLLVTQKKLPAKAGQLSTNTADKPKHSNGGQVLPRTDDDDHNHKKDEKKDEKKDAGKKDEKK